MAVLLFSLPNLLFIEPASNKSSPQKQGYAVTCSAEYEICPNVSWPDSLLFTFEAMTLQRWDKKHTVKKELFWGRALVSVQYILGPTVLALMVLAIRRQFKR
ncbi:MAG: hypothetical protein IIA62_10745 [Nitrospinae bacterium]|nr:hypothetical protein [Nitrospinota bacterium]